MFKDSIGIVANFTRPVHTILRTYGGKQIIPGAATLFFVNEEGYAITCKHVVQYLVNAQQFSDNFNSFKNERDKLTKDGKFSHLLKGLEMKYHLKSESEIQFKSTFVDCVDSLSGFTLHLHPTVDLAIIKFNDYNKLLYEGHAIFKKDSSQIKQGEFLCRLGFPFPEFNNFKYNETVDDIEWTDSGASQSPIFPIEGMLTRFLADNNQIFGIEMSTPGLKGQSGGPLFNSSGIVYGMQFSTKHLHLGFDLVETEIIHENKLKKVTDYSFIHLGQCIHVDVIKAFLREKQVKFYEE
ncbi:MAG: trypsin-like peptidase domain-containing protein [Bacteroidetes bacterium]|nr:trypsin-like peptidase domain-containing protein [Bacteroidota bacterium]